MIGNRYEWFVCTRNTFAVSPITASERNVQTVTNSSDCWGAKLAPVFVSKVLLTSCVMPNEPSKGNDHAPKTFTDVA